MKKMKINDVGFRLIQPEDTITITVTASNTEYDASFPTEPDGPTWSDIQRPSEVVEARQFVALDTLGSQCVVSIFFNFRPDANGAFPPDAKYVIKIEGELSGSFEDLPVEPPPPKNRTYNFEVAQIDGN